MVSLMKSLKVKDKVSYKRHIAKTVTWRIIGTLDTMLIGWLISGDPIIGVKIGFLEIFTKMLLYFIHERVWYRSNFGLNLVRKKDKR
jgi:uncharacterized membrane protein